MAVLYIKSESANAMDITTSKCKAMIEKVNEALSNLGEFAEKAEIPKKNINQLLSHTKEMTEYLLFL